MPIFSCVCTAIRTTNSG